jgi:hypothetical protein
MWYYSWVYDTQGQYYGRETGKDLEQRIIVVLKIKSFK